MDLRAGEVRWAPAPREICHKKHNYKIKTQIIIENTLQLEEKIWFLLYILFSTRKYYKFLGGYKWFRGGLASLAPAYVKMYTFVRYFRE